MSSMNVKGLLSALLLFSLQVFIISQMALPLQAVAGGTDATGTSAVTTTPSGATANCTYYFVDTYSGTQSSTPPSMATTGGGWNSGGPIVQLQFGSGSTTQYTTPVPCDGYYEVFFTLQIRNDAGTSCHEGLNSLAVWSTTTDSATPNAYGCPMRYYNGYWSGSSWINTNYSSSPGGNFISPYACATFSQYSQCAWGSNYLYGNMGCNGCGGYSIKAYPLPVYTNYWLPDRSGSVYTAGWFGPTYVEAYGGFCNGFDRQWSNGGYCRVTSSYPGVHSIKNWNYCSSKPFYFKNVIYLHKGATVSAPALQSLIAQTPYPNSFISGGSITWLCGYSVIGGKFTLTYLHP